MFPYPDRDLDLDLDLDRVFDFLPGNILFSAVPMTDRGGSGASGRLLYADGNLAYPGFDLTFSSEQLPQNCSLLDKLFAR